MHVFRCFTEKRPGCNVEARGLLHDLRTFLGITSLENLRIFNRYDVEGISEQVYDEARMTVFSEPQVDDIYDEYLPEFTGAHWILGVEALPGQFDQRADSCAQCIQMLTCLDRPAVAAAKFYIFFGDLTDRDRLRLSDYLINPVESRQAEEKKPETLARTYPDPPPVATVSGFRAAGESGLAGVLEEYGLAMDMDDLRFMQSYFRDTEGRDPTVTELRVIDTYWSDHCRHTTFNTQLDSVDIRDGDVLNAYNAYLDARREVYGDAARSRPETLMDIATICAKLLRRRGLLKNIDISEEVNACSIHVDALVDGRVEDWLLMFKNETHNHPTEIEPFGGAATCIGGAIRDPLAGRAYVYQAMRVTGAGDPRAPLSETLPGKLPQRQLTAMAARGYSSYGNQIGVATGLVHELYHPGYVAKRMEVGAVVGAVPAQNVVRETPAPGDVVLLLGGRTGRDGIGGATGSSKAHDAASIVAMASEVQKGNAPEERKIQRLFRDPQVTGMIRRCNDFGAGGVCVAIGELADGLEIDLSAVRKKYEGLNATELAISESQERMAVVVAPGDVDAFIEKATGENLEAYPVAVVTESPRMVMRHGGVVVADLSRAFLSSSGAQKHATAYVPRQDSAADGQSLSPAQLIREAASDLRYCSQRGLAELFDSSVGAGSVLAPYGGRTQKTPVQAMAALLPVVDGETTTCSVMSFGFDPYLSSRSPYAGAKAAVVSSVSKLVAAGCDPDGIYLTFQEYFERLRREPERWGKPLSALLGAFEAQLGLELAAIGGKDSMSGSFDELDVPPTLISFAIAPNDARYVLSPEFKSAGNDVVVFPATHDLPALKALFKQVRALVEDGVILSAWSVTDGGVAEGLLKMALGNRLGFSASADAQALGLFSAPVGSIIAEIARPVAGAPLLGRVTSSPQIALGGETLELSELEALWENGLESIFPTRADTRDHAAAIGSTARPVIAASTRFAAPRAVITAFPGTNCETDTARAVAGAGGIPDIKMIKNLTPALLEESVAAVAAAIRQSQMLIIPGGFSGGDEPDGSAKFITAFFRNPRIADAVRDLLSRRDGLILGICNGFQALIKLGLVPYGDIRTAQADSPTITHNLIGRHQSKYVYTRVSSLLSPWLSGCAVGDVFAMPVSHGEGRFIAPEALVSELMADGRVAAQYCDADGVVSQHIDTNPNGSVMAVEALTSPDGRVLGKMGHSERHGPHVAKNIRGNRHQPIFEGGVKYFL